MRHGLLEVSVLVLLCLVNGLFPLLELLPSHDVTLAVVPSLDELPGEFLILEVEKVLIAHLLVEIVLVLLVTFKLIVYHVAIVVHTPVLL